MLMTAKTEYSKSVTWNQCISPLGLVREKQCLISFMGQLSGSFGLAAAPARLKERFLNSWVQVLFWKTQKTPFLVLQWMRWILCSVAGEIPGNVEFQHGLLDLLCSARLGFQPYTLPGVFNFCNFSVLSLNLSGKIKRTHATPNCLWLHLCLLFFVSFDNKPLFLFIAPDLHFSSEQSLWGLGELGTSLKFYEICYMWSTKLISQFLPNFSNKLSHIYCSWVFLINSKYQCSCSWRDKSVFLIWIT